MTAERPVRGHGAPPTPPTPAPPKPLRADARRNRDVLVAAGRRVFLRAGADAPMDDVAKEAGVGRGTLYRHFPTREHLFVELLRERVDLLDARARALLGAPDLWAALTEWLALYDRSASEYAGMSARVGESLADESSPVAAACAPMKASFARLLDRARHEGLVRPDVSALQILAVVAALPKSRPAEAAPRGSAPAPARDPEPGIYLDIVLRGLRPRG